MTQSTFFTAVAIKPKYKSPSINLLSTWRLGCGSIFAYYHSLLKIADWFYKKLSFKILCNIAYYP